MVFWRKGCPVNRIDFVWFSEVKIAKPTVSPTALTVTRVAEIKIVKPNPAVGRRAEHFRSAQATQTSTCSAIASASSTSMPRYRTVLSILVCPSSHAPYYASSYLIETQRLVEQDLVLPDLLIASGRQKRPSPPP